MARLFPKKYKHVGGGTIQNRFGVKFSKREQRELKQLYHRAMSKRHYRRQKYINMSEKAKQNIEQGSAIMITPTKPTLQLDKFKTRSRFEKYMESLRDRGTRDFTDRRTAMYRNNMIRAITKAFPSEYADHLITELEALNDGQFRRMLVEHPDVTDIGFIYKDRYADRYNELLNVFQKAQRYRKW